MRRPSALAASLGSVLAIALSLGGCGSPGTTLGTSSSDLAGPSAVAWASVGYGINGATVGSGPNVLVVYGGYTATDADSEALSLQYVSAQLGALGVGHVYAVRGPEDAEYAAREIGNSHLAAQLEATVSSTGFVAIVAHSSGAFVADELFTEASTQVLSKIVYFDLDGGSWALNDTLVGEMRGVYFCNARDPTAGESANYSSIVSLHADFPASHYFTVDATGSGCNSGAVWCMHDTLITTRPHDPATYDLNDDYTDFTGTGRHVVTSQLQQAIADGVLAASPVPIDGGTPPPSSDAGSTAPTTSCALAGQSFANSTCTETLQCDDGAWVARTSDPADCTTGVEPGGACVTDAGAVVPENTCTATLQCNDGVWVDRVSDPAACL